MKPICHCAVCGNMLFEGEPLADLFKYDFDGELDYILLAHRACGIADNKERRFGLWQCEERITPLEAV